MAALSASLSNSAASAPSSSSTKTQRSLRSSRKRSPSNTKPFDYLKSKNQTSTKGDFINLKSAMRLIQIMAYWKSFQLYTSQDIQLIDNLQAMPTLVLLGAFAIVSCLSQILSLIVENGRFIHSPSAKQEQSDTSYVVYSSLLDIGLIVLNLIMVALVSTCCFGEGQLEKCLELESVTCNRFQSCVWMATLNLCLSFTSYIVS